MEINIDTFLTRRNISAFEYQRDAIEFMLARFMADKGTLLADTMGLGKTRELSITIAISNAINVLVVVPNSILYDWIEELRMICPDYAIFIARSGRLSLVFENDETFREGEIILQYDEVAEVDRKKIIICNFQAVIPTPPVLDLNGIKGTKRESTSDLEEYIEEMTPFRQFQWDLVVVDEVHIIRSGINVNLEKTKTVKSLTFCRMYRLRMAPGGVRIGATGTPIQNQISDIASILKFLGAPIRIGRRITAEYLSDLIHEYMFRRTDKDLNPIIRRQIGFPEDEYEETEIFVNYKTQEEENLYKRAAGFTVDDETEYEIQTDENPLVKCNMLNYLSSDINMFLRIYNNRHNTEHPFWTGTNSKHDMIADLLNTIDDSVLIFVHFYEEVDGICEAIDRLADKTGVKDLGFKIESMDGRTESIERKQTIERTKINIERGRKVLIFTTIKTSGVGLNLQFINKVMFSSSDWNPGNELQALTRVYRIGQTQQVKVYKFTHTYSMVKDKRHIDGNKIAVKLVKLSKSKMYAESEFNAARKWPIRNIEGTHEPSVIWNDIQEDAELTEKLEKHQMEDYRKMGNKQGMVTTVQKSQSSRLDPAKFARRKSSHKPTNIPIEQLRKLRLEAIEKRSA